MKGLDRWKKSRALEEARLRHPSSRPRNAFSPPTLPENPCDSPSSDETSPGQAPGKERTDEKIVTPTTDGRGGGAKLPPARSVAHGGSSENERRSESPDTASVRWVAKLDCGHSAGSRGKVRASSIPAVGASLLCSVCDPQDLRVVVDVVDSRPLEVE